MQYDSLSHDVSVQIWWEVCVYVCVVSQVDKSVCCLSFIVSQAWNRNVVNRITKIAYKGDYESTSEHFVMGEWKFPFLSHLRHTHAQNCPHSCPNNGIKRRKPGTSSFHSALSLHLCKFLLIWKANNFVFFLQFVMTTTRATINPRRVLLLKEGTNLIPASSFVAIWEMNKIMQGKILLKVSPISFLLPFAHKIASGDERKIVVASSNRQINWS